MGKRHRGLATSAQPTDHPIPACLVQRKPKRLTTWTAALGTSPPTHAPWWPCSGMAMKV